MKTNKILQLAIIPFSLLLILFLYFLPEKEMTEREKYEMFLNKKYKKLPDFCKEKSTNKPDNPGLSALRDYFMTIDYKLGRVPLERLKKAYKQTIALQKLTGAKSNSIEWNEKHSNMGGRTRAVMFDPNDTTYKKVWAGGVTGGLWYNNDITNDDSLWIPVNDFWDNLSISCITSDPDNPQIFYAGTGESQTAVTIYRESSGRGVGIWKSVDAGSSWELLSSTEDFAYITDIQVRNENGNSVIYAGVVSGLYQGQVHQSIPGDGLYRSIDNGLNWTQVLPEITGLTVSYAPSDIEIGADGRIYVGTVGNINGDGGSVILYSDSGTVGYWTKYEDYKIIIESEPEYNIPGRVMLACAPSDENIIYAVFAVGTNVYQSESFGTFVARYILRSDDKGVSWTEINTPSGNWATIAWHALTAAVDPNDPNILFAGGLDMNRTTNAGTSWTRLSDWAQMYSGGADDYIHADQHAIIFRPNSSDKILFATDGGIFYTENGTDVQPVFFQRNRNYNTLQFYTCDIYPTDDYNYLSGGLQDNGTLIYTGVDLSINSMISGGDGAFCFFDKDEPNIFISSYYDNNYYIFVDESYYASISDYSCGIFINPADYDYKNNTIYANAMSFSGNYEDKLCRIQGIPDGVYGDYLPMNTGSTVPYSCIKVSPYALSGVTTLFFGTQSGRLFRVDNAESIPQITEIGSTDFPPANISCIAIGGSEDTLLVTFSNYGVSSVWQTYDGGNTWQNKEGNLPDMPIRWAIYHPENSQQALLATEIGVWSTNELAQTSVTWQPSVNGLANVRVDMLKIREQDNTVLAATHGRGLFTAIYELNPYIDDGINDKVTKSDEIILYPNPSSGIINLKIGNIVSKKINFFVYNSSGKIISDIEVNNTNKIIQIDLSDYSKGIYFVKLSYTVKKKSLLKTDDNTIYTKKFIIQ